MARAMPVRFMSSIATRAKRLSSLEPLVYGGVALAWTLFMAWWFYSSMRWQLYNSIAWARGSEYDLSPHRPEFFPWPSDDVYVHIGKGLWSAPLDDVFIHFDFARSTARGFPLQWIDGNGCSASATSLLYPFVLAVGFIIRVLGFGPYALGSNYRSYVRSRNHARATPRIRWVAQNQPVTRCHLPILASRCSVRRCSAAWKSRF